MPHDAEPRADGPETPRTGESNRSPGGPKLLDRVRAALRVRRYSPRTEQAYVAWIRRFIVHQHLRHPAQMAAAEVTAFLSDLADRWRVSASTQNQARAALLFLYREVLGVELPWLDDLVRAKASPRVPVVLSRDEARRVLRRVTGVPGLMARLIYGTGVRVMECCRLRVKDIDFESNQIVVRSGKGNRDRRTVLPASLAAPLRRQLATARRQHER